VKLRKLLFTAFILLLAFSVVAASSYTVKSARIKFGETVEITSGRAGISFTKSQYSGVVKLLRSSGGNAPGEGAPTFSQKLLEVRLTDNQGRKVSHPLGAVYVFFKVKQREVRDWEDGTLAIYFYDTWKSDWVKCDTFEVRGGGSTYALGCRIRVMGLYGLGMK
jgi:hypothetical protein